MRVSRILVALIALLHVGIAAAGLVTDVEYRFEVGDAERSRITAQIEDVQMGAGVPLAVTGSAEVEMTLEVTGVRDDGTAVICATFGTLTSTLMGEKQRPTQPEPVTLRVDRHGRVLEATGGGGVDLFASGGVPIHLIVLMAGVVELPEEAIAVGDPWTIERRRTAPELGDITVRATSHLTRMTAAETMVLTDVHARFPEFKAQNPLQEGEITISNGVMTMQGMKRRIDPATGLVRAASGRLSFDCTATIGDFAALPLTVGSSFEIVPLADAGVEEPGEAHAPRPSVAPARGPVLQPQETPVWRIVESFGACIDRAFSFLARAWGRR